ncbi:uncharacterized protein [Apostichopus japonicus]|uniref:uncharacterized protein isoform X2 n=1 Tax=Stichopus japonicus TaxID=307972 RepID=UPI003AB1EF80
MTNPSEANLEVAGNPTDIVDCTIQTTLRDGTYIVYELFPTRKVTVREVDGKVREYNALEEVEIPGFTQEIKQVVSDAFGLSAPLQDQCQMQEEIMESRSSLKLSGGQLDPAISLIAEVRGWEQNEQSLFKRATSMPGASLPPDGDSHCSEENKYFQQATPVGSNSSSGSEEEDGEEEEEEEEDEEHLWFQQATPVGSNYFGDPEEENNEEEYEEHVYFQQATPVSSNSSSEAEEEDGEEEDEAHQYFQQATPVGSNYFGDPEEEYEEHQAPFRASFSFRSSVMSEEEVLQNEVDMLIQEHWLDSWLVRSNMVGEKDSSFCLRSPTPTHPSSSNYNM